MKRLILLSLIIQILIPSAVKLSLHAAIFPKEIIMSSVEKPGSCEAPDGHTHEHIAGQNSDCVVETCLARREIPRSDNAAALAEKRSHDASMSLAVNLRPTFPSEHPLSLAEVPRASNVLEHISSIVLRV